jgi:hypothetical protein
MEILTFLGSGLMSGIMTLWGKSMENKAALFEHAMAKGEAQAKIYTDARAAGSKGFQLTRRAIALMVIFAVIVWPMFVPVFWPNVPVTIGWTEMTNGFLFFTDPKESVKWISFPAGGLVVTPLMTHLSSAISGFFFGNQITK